MFAASGVAPLGVNGFPTVMELRADSRAGSDEGLMLLITDASGDSTTTEGDHVFVGIALASEPTGTVRVQLALEDLGQVPSYARSNVSMAVLQF